MICYHFASEWVNAPYGFRENRHLRGTMRENDIDPNYPRHLAAFGEWTTP
jgi:hypothetical protein